MIRNSTLFLSFIFLFSACSERSPKTLISHFEKKSETDKVLERAIANLGEGGKCLIDIFNVDTLESEVKELEQKLESSPKSVGTWKHLDLSTLPSPQSHFLKKYGKDLGDLNNPDAFDYSSCRDVPCIYNKIYGKDKDVAGYVHYLWYLRFGHMLAADNKIPVQKSKNPGEYQDKTHSFDKYLFSHKELYALWRLSHMLKAPHTTLNYLKEVQKIPRGENFETASAAACGLAYSSGYILLTDDCLSLSSDQDMGFLYQAITHELSHHIDFESGRGSKKIYRSHKDDYLELAGFFMEEYVDKDGKAQRRWAHKKDIKLVSQYAGTAPEENFAESIAFFRVEGDITKKNLTNEHYDFVSKEFYFSQSFERERIFKSWIEEYQPDILQKSFKAVIDCSKEKSSPKSVYFSPKDFSNPLLPQMLNCLGERALEMTQELKNKTMLYKPDGCRAHNHHSMEGKWNAFMKEALIKIFDKYVEDLKKDPAYLGRIKSFYDDLSDKTPAREAYVNCYGESDEPKCFSDLIRKRATEKALALNLPDDQTNELIDMYASYHSYETVKDELKKSYHDLVKSQIEGIRSEAKTLWKSCEGISHNDSETPSGSVFQIADGYMVSSFYNCLNSEAPSSIKNAVRGISVNQMKVQNAKEELILFNEVKPAFLSLLTDIYKMEREKEEKSAADLLSKEQGQLRSDILSSFHWVKNVVDNQQIMSDCKKRAYELIKLKPLFHLPKTLFSDYLEKNTCLNISTSKEFTSWLEGSKGQFSEKITSGLDEKMLIAGTNQAKACVKEFPVDSAVNKIRFRKEREACLMNKWSDLENSTLSEVLNDPLVIKFQVSSVELKSKLELNRRRLQLRLMKEYFN